MGDRVFYGVFTKKVGTVNYHGLLEILKGIKRTKFYASCRPSGRPYVLWCFHQKNLDCQLSRIFKNIQSNKTH